MNGVERLDELDALRGIAALTVVGQHCLLVSPWIGGGAPADALAPGWVGVVGLPPFAASWSGQEAVMLFFVLSGFVLALPFYRGVVSTSAWCARRVLRIYPPYLAAIALSVALWQVIPPASGPGTSDWLEALGRESPSLSLLAQHALLIGSFDNDAFIPVVWSLVIEMRLSLLFPLLMLLVLSTRWWVTLLACLALFVVGRGGHWWGNTSGVMPGDHFATLMYVYPFAVGALLARHRITLIVRLRHAGPGVRIGLWVLALALYQYAAFAPDAHTVTVRRVFGHFPTVTGIALLIALVLSSERVRGTLTRAPLVFLGRISYSLYLVHAIVLVAAVHVMEDAPARLPTLTVVVTGVSLALATLWWWAIERPSIALSRSVGRWLERRDRRMSRPVKSGSSSVGSL